MTHEELEKRYWILLGIVCRMILYIKENPNLEDIQKYAYYLVNGDDSKIEDLYKITMKNIKETQNEF